MRIQRSSAHIRGMTTDPRASAITAADPSLAEHPELLERFLAAAQTAGLLADRETSNVSAPAQGLNRGQLVALLDSFDDVGLKVSVDGTIGTPGLYRFTASRNCVTAHLYRRPAYRVTVREFSDQLSAIRELPTQFGTILIIDDNTPVRFTDTDSKSPGWWIITGAEARGGSVRLLMEAEARA